MSQAERSPGKSFENTLDFFAKQTAPIFDEQMKPISRKDPDEFYPPIGWRQTEEDWVRNWEMTGLYVGTDATLDEIGKQYGDLTRERARQIVKKNTKNLHNASDPAIQQAYPFDSLEMGKPVTLGSRKKRSLAGGGSSIRLAELIEKGKSLEEIRRKSGLTIRQIGKSRLRIKNWGVNAPYREKASSPEYKEKFNRLKTQKPSDEEVRIILNSVTYRTYRENSKGENPLFNPISNLAREAGLFISNREARIIASVLRGKRIPVGLIHWGLSEKQGRKAKVHRYYFIFSGHKERAIEVLQTDQAFDQYRKNPVRSLRSEDDAVPSLYQLMFKDSYSPVGKILAELGYPNIHKTFKRTISDLIVGDCPVPVFQSRHGNFYESSQKEALKAYLEKRISQLRRENK